MSYKALAEELMDAYPSIRYLERKAKARIPNVAWQYLHAGTGEEQTILRNRARLNEITLVPQFVKGKLEPKLKTKLFGKVYSVPFGIAPVGLSGLIWPHSEFILANTAKRNGFPYCLSTVTTQTPEDVGTHVGNMGWFQLYPPKDPMILEDLLKRAKTSGFHTLMLTADVPAPGRREKSRKAGLTSPPKITPKLAWEGITHPAWLSQTLLKGMPELKTIKSYCKEKDSKAIAEFTRFKFRGDLDWDYVKKVRDLWEGPIILKGILHPKDAEDAVNAGLDGIGVSNHGGRQFDGAPSAIEALPAIKEITKGETKIIFDSGITSGLDIIRALALGADFVLLGRAFMYGVAAIGKYGGEHVAQILTEDLTNNMTQLGVNTLEEVKTLTPYGM